MVIFCVVSFPPEGISIKLRTRAYVSGVIMTLMYVMSCEAIRGAMGSCLFLLPAPEDSGAGTDRGHLHLLKLVTLKESP